MNLQSLIFHSPKHTRLGLRTFATLQAAWRNPALRPLIPEINKLRRSLPAWYESQPLPDFLAQITPAQADLVGVDRDALRELLDAIALLDRRSPFGLCLRRSLLRYHFMRRAGLTLGITFGMRFRQPHEGKGVAGHAWNTLDGEPYHEREEDYAGFTVVYVWPEREGE